jgi:hypothetical protein
LRLFPFGGKIARQDTSRQKPLKITKLKWDVCLKPKVASWWMRQIPMSGDEDDPIEQLIHVIKVKNMFKN